MDNLINKTLLYAICLPTQDLHPGIPVLTIERPNHLVANQAATCINGLEWREQACGAELPIVTLK